MGRQTEEYIVEKIVDKRVRRGKTEYFLKWRNYPSEENTWEPVEHLNCRNLIVEFEDNLARTKEANTNGIPKRKSRSIEEPEEEKQNVSVNQGKSDSSPVKKKKTEKMKTPNRSITNGVRSKPKSLEKKSNEKSRNFEKITLRDCKSDDSAKNKKKRESNTKKKDVEKFGFDRKLKPLEIVAATENDGELMFLMKWEKCEESDLVPAKEAHERCPQLVIKFYEERINWKTISK